MVENLFFQPTFSVPTKHNDVARIKLLGVIRSTGLFNVVKRKLNSDAIFAIHFHTLFNEKCFAVIICVFCLEDSRWKMENGK